MPTANKLRRLRDREREKKKAAFIELLTKGWTISAACLSVDLNRRVAYTCRDSDPEFAEAWDEALEAGNEMLEQEAFRRAVEGHDRPVYIKGEMVGTVREFSDQLLMFLLKGRRPEKFRERVDMTTNGQSLVSHFAKALLEQPPDGDRPRPQKNSPTQH